MAGTCFKINGSLVFIDYADSHGECIINGKTHRWEFHEYMGPLFLRKDGEPLVRQPSEKNPVWKEFDKWYKKYSRTKRYSKHGIKTDDIEDFFNSTLSPTQVNDYNKIYDLHKKTGNKGYKPKIIKISNFEEEV